MKLHRLLSRSVCLVGGSALMLAVTACSGGASAPQKPKASTSTTASAAAANTKSAAPEAPMPTAKDLNAILAIASDPAKPVSEKVKTVQGGESAPQLFKTMAQSKKESGANFTVVPPVLEGYTPNSVLTVVKFTLPKQQPQTIKDVEFVYENGTWKLSRSWACTLINSAVPPEKVPAMCKMEKNKTPGQPAAGGTKAPAKK